MDDLKEFFHNDTIEEVPQNDMAKQKPKEKDERKEFRLLAHHDSPTAILKLAKKETAGNDGLDK